MEMVEVLLELLTICIFAQEGVPPLQILELYVQKEPLLTLPKMHVQFSVAMDSSIQVNNEKMEIQEMEMDVVPLEELNRCTFDQKDQQPQLILVLFVQKVNHPILPKILV